MEGISRRELARRHGISETTVRRHIDSGSLADAMLRDGSIHPRRAAEALKRSLSNAKVVPRELVDARTRRLRVQVAKLTDEVDDLRKAAILPADAEKLVADQVAIAARHLRTVPGKASELAGHPAAEVIPALRGLIFNTLEAIAEEGDPEDEWWNEPVEPPAVIIESLSPNALLARRIDLVAVKMEIEHALGRGKLVHVGAVAIALEERLTVLKSGVLAIPARVAHAVEAASAEEAVGLITAEMEELLVQVAA